MTDANQIYMATMLAQAIGKTVGHALALGLDPNMAIDALQCVAKGVHEGSYKPTKGELN
ncbi:hypothetical protein JCM17846_28940 [Iodidimonas nitroreducens]|uniref:Uncharacterized protein n=1 Tax=Iodidimonas nitroreducens TaxID=1236968 RepID=A0A5A7NAF1_9PROT|nr:hypothetical protein [Iodidimonas nitroreducens]GAK34606.1 hypothetical protein AQ1_02505 [alpha proteobacterium Q-1]GER05212.1 hypothetical protein JCM17846_28940 [Iodidimonas nitroreducens]